MKTRHTLISFSLTLALVSLLAPTEPAAQHYTVDNGWKFINFGTDVLDWELYRDTFIGIPPTRDPASSAFDVLFYDYVYKDQLAGPGNCYGMSLLSLLIVQKGGHMGICAPVSQYSGDLVGINPDGSYAGPSSARLYRVINQLHGHQVHKPSLELYLDLLARGKTRDGQYAYSQVEYYGMRDDPCVVSITRSLNPADGGHSLAAYDYGDYGANDKRIYVYDPNRSWYHSTQSFYASGSNYVTIKDDGSWSYPFSTTETWSGSPSSGGNLIIEPISIAGPRSRSPSTLGLNALDFLNEFFITGDGAELEQITNSKGKRFFKPGTMEVDMDPSTGMLNIVPWFPNHAEDTPLGFSSYYLLGNPGGELEIKVKSGDSGYRLDVFGPHSHMRIQTLDGFGTDILKIKDPGSTSPVLKLQNAVNAEKYAVTFVQNVKSGKRMFQLTDLAIPEGEEVEFGVVKNQSAMEVKTELSEFGYNMEIHGIFDGKESVLQLGDLLTTPGNRQIISPPSWSTFEGGTLIIDTKPLEFTSDLIIEP